MNLFMPIAMGSKWNASMGYGVVFTPGYLLTRQITQKSESIISSIPVTPEINLFLYRALLSLIRTNGNCPCPRCLVEKSEIHKLGQIRDGESRLSRVRSYAGDLIRTARSFIYEKGFNVASAAVERLLFAHSWVPTLVSASFILIYLCVMLTYNYLEHLCGEARCPRPQSP